MGKKAKEHRAKVARRNKRIAEQKSKIQKTFDKMIQDQINKTKDDEQLSVQMGEKPLEFSFVESNDSSEEPKLDFDVTNTQQDNG